MKEKTPRAKKVSMTLADNCIGLVHGCLCHVCQVHQAILDEYPPVGEDALRRPGQGRQKKTK